MDEGESVPGDVLPAEDFSEGAHVHQHVWPNRIFLFVKNGNEPSFIRPLTLLALKHGVPCVVIQLDDIMLR